MLVPAGIYKEQIEKAFNAEQYSEKLFWYDGSIDNYPHEVTTEGDKYAFAIVHSGQVIGYVSFRIDWYCSCAFNFSLIKFLDIYFENSTQEYKSSTPLMISAIREIMRMIKSYSIHRIDFRCVSGNPAIRGYTGIIQQIEKQNYSVKISRFRDNIKDRQGKYHDTIMYEMIRE